MKYPLAKFCGCDNEPLPSKPGDKVYVKSRGVLTLNAKEAHAAFPKPVGVITEDHSFKLNAEAERAIRLAGI